VKFSKDGKFIKTWGKRRARGPGEFDTPHAMTMDQRGGRLFVGVPQTTTVSRSSTRTATFIAQ